MTVMDQALIAAAAVTALNFIWLQADALYGRNDVSAAVVILPFICWGIWLVFLFGELRFNPEGRPMWPLEMLFWTISAASFLFVITAAVPNKTRNAKRKIKRQMKVRKSGAVADQKQPSPEALLGQTAAIMANAPHARLTENFSAVQTMMERRLAGSSSDSRVVATANAINIMGEAPEDT